MSTTRMLASKVPEVTLYFWIIKILGTTVGETAADALNVDLGFGLTGTTLVIGIMLAAALTYQFTLRRYVPWIYWLVVILISVAGTLITDNITDNFGVPLATSTGFFTAALILTFAAWYFAEGTLSIHSIRTRRREGFYWLAILFTFALGTAAGDLVAEQIELGYLTSALIFAAIIALVAAAHYALRLNAVLAFWIAYIITRPLGASIGDYLTQDKTAGGLGLGPTLVTAVFVIAIVGSVTYLTISKADVLDTTFDSVDTEDGERV
ncbi:hypothetical protein [Rhodococcus sp. H29-C3]|uniref:COG4705 family protein n=1 Tax=Rhodococcus sp. H29-C3 TaxID=3046307 RepID=UPI0024BB3AD4|nr:hypothetical protein [Rhodococcus sp. H29-C3]MDJ0361951.1 hypothetical protein [Rhodococcus sp. H29-C3]